MASPIGPSETDAWFAEAKALERRGQVVRAYDVAVRAHAAAPEDWRFAHLAVLALARAGAARRARASFEALGLDRHLGQLDVAALAARLDKDRGLAAQGAERIRWLSAAAEAYAAAYDTAVAAGRTDAYYPAINAATLSLLIGRPAAARSFAAAALAGLETSETRDDAAYWRAATAIEAHLILSQDTAAEAWLDVLLAHTEWGDRATTLRHLRLVTAARGSAPPWLARLEPPAILHYADAVPGLLPKDGPVGLAFGSLAPGGEIKAAEALLAAGAALHVVLPYPAEIFRQVCVEPAGGDWPARFDACLAAAAQVRHATTERVPGADACAMAYAREFAAGLAVLEACHIGAAVRPAPPVATAPPKGDRVVRAMLAADLQHYSTFGDAEADRLVLHVFGTIARALAPHDAAIETRNTWGDGIFIVFREAASAAACALDLIDAVAALDHAALGLSHPVAIRIGLHLGPVLRVEDPIVGRPNVYGAHASRASRIEPITPANSAYVTEPMAAALALASPSRVTCDYCGWIEAAKGFGTMRLFLLERAA